MPENVYSSIRKRKSKKIDRRISRIGSDWIGLDRTGSDPRNPTIRSDPCTSLARRCKNKSRKKPFQIAKFRPDLIRCTTLYSKYISPIDNFRIQI